MHYTYTKRKWVFTVEMTQLKFLHFFYYSGYYSSGKYVIFCGFVFRNFFSYIYIFFFLYLTFLSFYTWSIYHHFFSYLYFFVIFLLVFPFFWKKYYFLFFTLEIFIILHLTYLYHSFIFIVILL
jgi:hypothetical protein